MSNLSIYKAKETLRLEETNKLKKNIEKEAWISLRQYFEGAGNGSEAKLAIVALGILVKERQADNNKRAIDLAYEKHYNKHREIKCIPDIEDTNKYQ